MSIISRMKNKARRKSMGITFESPPELLDAMVVAVILAVTAAC
ncbi:hypothetical protein V7157_26285 [Neobacillus drentensis]